MQTASWSRFMHGRAAQGRESWVLAWRADSPLVVSCWRAVAAQTRPAAELCAGLKKRLLCAVSACRLARYLPSFWLVLGCGMLNACRACWPKRSLHGGLLNLGLACLLPRLSLFWVRCRAVVPAIGNKPSFWVVHAGSCGSAILSATAVLCGNIPHNARIHITADVYQQSHAA